MGSFVARRLVPWRCDGSGLAV